MQIWIDNFVTFIQPRYLFLMLVMGTLHGSSIPLCSFKGHLRNGRMKMLIFLLGDYHLEKRETCRIESIVSIILVHLKNYVYDITDFSSLVFLPHWLLKHSCFPLLVPRRRGIISSIENSNCVSLDCICWFFFFNFTLCISSFFFRLHHAPGTA